MALFKFRKVDTFTPGTDKMELKDQGSYYEIKVDNKPVHPETLPIDRGGTGAENVQDAKENLGLENVANYEVANQDQAEDGSSNQKYMTPLRTKEAIIKQDRNVRFVNSSTYNVTLEDEGATLIHDSGSATYRLNLQNVPVGFKVYLINRSSGITINISTSSPNMINGVISNNDINLSKQYGKITIEKIRNAPASDTYSEYIVTGDLD